MYLQNATWPLILKFLLNMYYIPKKKMDVNHFVKVLVPSKGQIFARTGKTAVSPAGSFSGDDPARFGKTPTQSAMEFAKAAESFSLPKEDLPNE